VPTLTPAQIAGYARQAGFQGPALVTATAVALAESGGRTDAVNVNTNGSRDLGLWQLNDSAHPWVKSINWQDPAANAQGAKRIYDEAKGSFRPWVAYTSGSSTRFNLQAAQAAGAPAAPAENAGWLDKLNPLDDVADAASSAADGVKLAASAGVWLSNPHNWLRVVYVVAGGALIIAGAQLTVSGQVNKVAAPITGVVKKVATKGKA
jgi:lysozyme-like protein